MDMPNSAAVRVCLRRNRRSGCLRYGRLNGGYRRDRCGSRLCTVGNNLDVVIADAYYVLGLQRAVLLVDDLAVNFGGAERAVILDEITIGTAMNGRMALAHRPAAHHDKVVVSLADRAGVDLAFDAILLAFWRFDFNGKHVAPSRRRWN